jgi:hypothetical protein
LPETASESAAVLSNYRFVTVDASHVAQWRDACLAQGFDAAVADQLTVAACAAKRSAMLARALAPGRERRTCHWCGKDAHHRREAAQSRYCANVYCDKASGQSQFICGKCVGKQAAHFRRLGVDLARVFGDMDADDWYCMDCCENELGCGSCWYAYGSRTYIFLLLSTRFFLFAQRAAVLCHLHDQFHLFSFADPPTHAAARFAAFSSRARCTRTTRSRAARASTATRFISAARRRVVLALPLSPAPAPHRPCPNQPLPRKIHPTHFWH